MSTRLEALRSDFFECKSKLMDMEARITLMEREEADKYHPHELRHGDLLQARGGDRRILCLLDTSAVELRTYRAEAGSGFEVNGHALGFHRAKWDFIRNIFE